MLERHQRIRLIGYAVVILFCYSISAIFQEKVLRRPYGDGEGERFTFAFAFTAAQCIVYASVAKAVITVRKHPKNETPQRFFCIIGVFYVLAKVTSYMSLRYVPYPTSIVGKSAKPIPVMLLGVLIGRKTYTMYKYIFVTIVVIGVALFTFKEKYDKKDGEDPILGIIFIGVSLLMDGFLGAFEDRMRSVKKPTPLNLMFFMNCWNSLYLLSYLITTSEGVDFFKFCYRHPIVIRDLSVVVFFGIFGQFCITSMIAHYGALPLSITTTIRKFVTVLLSVMIFNNVLSIRQWIAASIIFIALFLDGHFSRKGKKSSKEKTGGENGDIKENHIENGGEVIKRAENNEKVDIEETENEKNSLKKNLNRHKRVRVSFEGDMLDEINCGFEDSSEDVSKEESESSTMEKGKISDKNLSKNEEKACKVDKDLTDVNKASEKNGETICKDDKVHISDNKVPTENPTKVELNGKIEEPVTKVNQVLSQENAISKDLTTNDVKPSQIYPEIEKKISESENNSLNVTSNDDIDSKVQDSIDKIEEALRSNDIVENSEKSPTEVVSDSSDDTKL